MAQGKSRKFIKTFLNIPKWTGSAYLLSSARSIKSLAKSLFTVKKPEFEETFEEAIARLNLSEEALQKRQKNYLITAACYFICAVFMFAYMIYLIKLQHIMASISALSLTLVLLAFFFRDHFWYTQIKQKKLGLSFSDWLQHLFKIK